MDEMGQRTTATTDTGPDRLRDAWLTHHERLWRSVLAWSGDREVASDAVAEAFAQAARRGDAVNDVSAWVWRAAFRIARGMLADRRRRDGGPVPDGADVAGSPGEDVAALLNAFAQLSDDDRTTVVLSLVGGWSSAEVGRLLGCSAGAVRVRLHRAKTRLRTRLEVHDG